MISDFEYTYQYKDHLGNIRLSYQDMDSNGTIDPITEIKEENHYYPFGLKDKGYNNSITGRDHNYGFGGKEEQNELGLNWQSYKWRNADATLGRFFGVDPISEDYPNQTVYQFASNNPVWKIEIEGLEGYVPNGGDLLNGIGFGVHTILPQEDYSSGGEVKPVDPKPEPELRPLSELSFMKHPSSEIRSGMFNDGEFIGFLTPATDQHYKNNPGGAFVKDLSFTALAFFGFDGIDNAIVTVSDPNVPTAEKVLTGTGVLLTPRGGGKGKVSNSGRLLPKFQTNGGRALDPKTGQALGGSGKARAITVKHASRKKAKDAARNGGKGTPVKHTKDKKGGNHYHHGNGKKGKGKGTKEYGGRAGKKSDNVHHEY